MKDKKYRIVRTGTGEELDTAEANEKRKAWWCGFGGGALGVLALALTALGGIHQGNANCIGYIKKCTADPYKEREIINQEANETEGH